MMKPNARLLLATLIAGASLTAPMAQAQTAPAAPAAATVTEGKAAPAPEARIAFASSIRDFRVKDEEVIYLRSGSQWYQASFFAPCHDIRWANRIGFKPSRGMSSIDRHSSVIVPGERECQLTSLVKIEGDPPSDAKKPSKKSKKEATTEAAT